MINQPQHVVEPTVYHKLPQPKAHSRRQVYLLFIGLLRQRVDQHSWRQLVDWSDQAHTNEILSSLVRWVQQQRQLSASQLMALALDHTRLLTGVGEHFGPPPPFEHLYSHDYDRIRCLQRVDYFYRQVDLRPLDPFNHVSDHIVSQLQFMAQDSVDQSLRLRFVHQHILNWLENWQRKLEGHPSHSDFYQTIVTTLRAYVLSDVD